MDIGQQLRVIIVEPEAIEEAPSVEPIRTSAEERPTAEDPTRLG